MNKIPLANSEKFALVDDEGLPIIGDRKWCLSPDGYAYIARYESRTKKSIPVKMERILVDVPLGMCIDHINRNRLDNRFCNLRIVTRAENNRHVGARNTKVTSRFKGVCLRRGPNVNLSKPWRVQIYAKKKYNIGDFASEIEAAKAYDEAATRLHGEFAVTNKQLGLL